MIISKIQKLLGKSSSWIIASVLAHSINISKRKPLKMTAVISNYQKNLPSKKRFWLTFKILIMNVLHGVWSDIYILQIIIQEQFEKTTKILQKNLILKTWNIPLKSKIFTKLKKRSVFGYENKENNSNYVSNTFKRHFDLLLMGEDKRHDILIND